MKPFVVVEHDADAPRSVETDPEAEVGAVISHPSILLKNSARATTTAFFVVSQQ